MRRLLLAAVLLGLWATPASAANLYVDNACTFNGLGTTDSCAASGGAAGRYNNLPSALAAAVADDVIIVHVGSSDYVTTTGNGYSSAVGFQFANSGTSGHPITLRNATGERPVLRACSAASTTVAACDRATITAFDRSYITITSANCPTNGPVGEMGLSIYGLVIFYDDHSTEVAMAHGNSMTCTEVQRGYTTSGDGNWSTLWVQGQYGFTARWNNLHDISRLGLTGAGGQSSRAAIKFFQTSNSTFSDNTITNIIEETNGSSGEFGVALDCKADCVNNTFERNNVRNANMAFRIENQETSPGPYTSLGATGTIIRNNVFVSDSTSNRGALRFEAGIITDLTVYNNTFVGFNEMFEETHPTNFPQPETNCQGIVEYNNAYVSPVSTHLHLSDGSGTECTLSAPSDYSYFTNNVGFRYAGTNRATLAAFSGATGFETHGSYVSAASFLFTNAGTGDYTLQAGSPLKAAGHVGGVSGGAAIDVGAYTSTVTCVGHLCGAAGAAAPTVTSASPSSGTTAGGTAITITGADFVSTPTITVGGVTCTSPGFTNSTTITCTTGAHAAGAVNIIVTNPDAQTGTGTNAFTYTAPASGPYRLRFR